MRLNPRQLLLTAIVMAGGVAGTMPLAWAQGQPQTSETLQIRQHRAIGSPLHRLGWGARPRH